MLFRFITIGALKENAIAQVEAEYIKRLRPMLQFHIEELDPPAKYASLPERERKEKETQLMLDRVTGRDFLILLDETGKAINSREFASLIDDTCQRGTSNFIAAIGGPHGWAPAARRRANFCLSLSRLTFPYQLARLVMVEQIYRVMTILRGMPYHK